MIITGFLCWSEGLLVVCLVGKGGGSSGLQVCGVGGARDWVGGVTEGGVAANSEKLLEVTLAWLQRKLGGGMYPGMLSSPRNL